MARPKRTRRGDDIADDSSLVDPEEIIRKHRKRQKVNKQSSPAKSPSPEKPTSPENPTTPKDPLSPENALNPENSVAKTPAYLESTPRPSPGNQPTLPENTDNQYPRREPQPVRLKADPTKDMSKYRWDIATDTVDNFLNRIPPFQDTQFFRPATEFPDWLKSEADVAALTKCPPEYETDQKVIEEHRTMARGKPNQFPLELKNLSRDKTRSNESLLRQYLQFEDLIGMRSWIVIKGKSHILCI
jgi:hypothetical protein